MRTPPRRARREKKVRPIRGGQLFFFILRSVGKIRGERFDIALDGMPEFFVRRTLKQA